MNIDKNREIVFDYIRVVAMICVVFYHFEMEYHARGIELFTHSLSCIGNINLGGIGVFLFFMISGALLHKRYQNELDLFLFYKKRVKKIYPLFWVCYFIAWMLDELLFQIRFDVNAPWKIVLTVLACDSYFPFFNPTYYRVGEWFTPVIMCIYLVYPFIRSIMTDKRLLIGLILLDILVLTNIMNPLNIVADGNIFFAMTAFVLGANLDIDNVIRKPRVCVALSFGICVLALVLSRIFPSVVLNLGVAASVYFLMLRLSRILKKRTEITWLAKYSYGIYLTHHYVVRRMVQYSEKFVYNVIISAMLFIGFTLLYTILADAINDMVKVLHKEVKMFVQKNDRNN